MAIVLFLSIFLLALPFLLFILLNHSKTKNVDFNLLPPGPSGLPLIGHLHMQMFDNSSPHIFLWKLSQKYGSLVSLRLGFKPVLVVSSAKLAEHVMKTHDLDFCSRSKLVGTSKLSYDTMDLAFSPYNAYWREMRKICVVHLFSRVQKYRSIREDEVARLIGKISRLSVDSKPVNLSEAMMFLSNSIICRVAFGKRYDEEGAERSRFQELLKEYQVMFSSFSFADYFPLMGWIDRFTGFRARLVKTFEESDMFYQELIDEHLDLSRVKPEQEDIVDVLLRLRKDRDLPFDLTIDHIKAILMNLLIGGTDTISSTVVWVMSFLMKNTKYLKKAQAEVRDLIRKKDFVNEDDVQNLPYLKAVINETFRLQPTVPLLVPRETLRKCDIGGYQVAAKTLVYVNAYAVGRDPEAWENPEEFCPERFIDSSIDYKGQSFELIPFGAGRRICPAMRMGITTVGLVLANFLYKFEWEMPIGMKTEELDFDDVPGITSHKKNALVLVARKIED